MKKVISIICITLLVALYSCDERDDLRSDIDNLKERVANLEASIEQMNSDISNYQQMVEGKILVVGYSKDEQDNYTIELSNGETVTIYSGKVDMNDMPLFSVNASGHWAYTINDMTTELLVNDKPVSAIPEAGTAGVTPKLKVDANGLWLVSIDNGSTWNKLGNNQIADGTQAVANASSLFSNVTIDEATGQITFTIRADNSQVKVPIYGKDFYLTIKYEGTATFGLGQKQEFVVEQANVETATIENQTWGRETDGKQTDRHRPQNKRARERIRRTDLHQDILERRLLPGSETSGKTADHEDRCQLGNSLATLQDRRKQCAARLFVCRI